MYVSPMTPQEALALHPEHIAYIENLTAANAPTLTIDADPDGGTDEPITLTFLKPESLARVKAVLLAEMHRSHRLLEDELAAGNTPSNYTPAPCPKS
jgi:hypothetical protein